MLRAVIELRILEVLPQPAVETILKMVNNDGFKSEQLYCNSAYVGLLGAMHEGWVGRCKPAEVEDAVEHIVETTTWKRATPLKFVDCQSVPRFQ